MGKVCAEDLRLVANVIAGLKCQFNTFVIFLVPKDSSLVNDYTRILQSKRFKVGLKLVELTGKLCVSIFRVLETAHLLLYLGHFNPKSVQNLLVGVQSVFRCLGIAV